MPKNFLNKVFIGNLNLTLKIQTNINFLSIFARAYEGGFPLAIFFVNYYLNFLIG